MADLDDVTVEADEEPDSAFIVIADAFALAYGTDGEISTEYWEDGARLAVTMLIERGFLPKEADA